jgi:hypothetical protein
MISHYVDVHEYAPPDEFLRTVDGAPLPGTTEYQRAIAIFVGRGLPGR